MQKKLRRQGICLLTGIIVIGGIYAVLAAPENRMTADQQKLQTELIENAVLLEQQEEEAAQLPEEIESESVTLIGDSVMLGAAAQLQKAIPGCIVDAREARQIWDTIDTVQELEAKGALGNRIIIGLGANGSFDKNMGQKLLDEIGSDKKVCWITVYGKYLGWQEDVNRMIGELAEENDHVAVLDFAKTAADHEEWFYDDGMHLNEEGQAAYAEFIAGGL